MAPGAGHLIGLLDLHHHRMIARWRNIMDTVACRRPPVGTVAAEIAFLTEEVAAFRAFVDRQAEALAPLLDGGAKAVLRVEAAALHVDMRALQALVQRRGEGDSAVMVTLAILGERFPVAIHRSHAAFQRAVTERHGGVCGRLHALPSRAGDD
ncbi:hypothetical protein [Roseospira goensis]|uniref:Uncharacterized protein n=1 Tax=Roseospira goensis TaxID=391922 RepID=A0A7W6RY02_9PROT|nr:hypothetical protein [Roseospira goensis]MBB4285321.1 hypothetical protein [Roseospira goensis]